LWKIWVGHWEGWKSHIWWKIKFIFETTNQIIMGTMNITRLSMLTMLKLNICMYIYICIYILIYIVIVIYIILYTYWNNTYTHMVVSIIGWPRNKLKHNDINGLGWIKPNWLVSIRIFMTFGEVSINGSTPKWMVYNRKFY
jgi:hypothetical protein